MATQMTGSTKERNYPESTVTELRAEIDKLRNDTEVGNEINRWKNMYFEADKRKLGLAKEFKKLT